MKHAVYQKFVCQQLEKNSNNPLFAQSLDTYQKEAEIIFSLNLDPTEAILKKLYCPSGRGSPRDPICMLRALLLMTLLKESSITKWVRQMRLTRLFAILAGFRPGDEPGIGTYYDFLDRIIDGPFRKCREDSVLRSGYNSGLHERHLKKEQEEKKKKRDPNQPASAILAKKLLAESEIERPDDLNKFLEDLLVKIAVVPSIEAGLFTDLKNMIVTGDGSILQTGTSPFGKPFCDCRKNGDYNCNHPKLYASPTAQWCYDAAHDMFKFGDRYYHLVVTQNGHDVPIQTLMPGGNVSDHTLSLEALDRFLKMSREHDLGLGVSVFCGDGHHDTYAHYEYLGLKGIRPVIPLGTTKNSVYPHLVNDDTVRLDEDGTPLCPAGKRMRRHGYNKKKQTHVYCCPAKRGTHKNKKALYVMRDELCPRNQDCLPKSSLGPFVYIKSAEDPRLFPEIPRGSKFYNEVMNLRSGSERCNALIDSYGLERCSRNADRALVRIFFVNIVHHAVLRYRESLKDKKPPPPYPARERRAAAPLPN